MPRWGAGSREGEGRLPRGVFVNRGYLEARRERLREARAQDCERRGRAESSEQVSRRTAVRRAGAAMRLIARDHSTERPRCWTPRHRKSPLRPRDKLS